MFLFKLFFRSLWEVASVPLEALLPFFIMAFSIFLVYLPFLLIIGLFVAAPSVLESFAAGYFGMRAFRSQQGKGWGKRILRAILGFLLGAIIWCVGLFGTMSLVIFSTSEGWVLIAVGFVGAVLFRRYVARWIFAGFRLAPWAFRRLQAVI